MKSHLLIAVFFLILCLPERLWGTSLESKITSPILLEAWGVLKAGNTKECLQKLSKYQPNRETKVIYHFIYGRALEKTNMPLEALEHYRSAFLNAPPGELQELTFLERADGNLRVGHYNEARLIYSLFLTKYNKSKYLERANLGMGRSLIAGNMIAQSLPYFVKAGESPEAFFGRAVTLSRLGRFKESNEQFSQGISKDKEMFLASEEHFFYYGDNLHHLGNDKEAIEYLSKDMKSPVMKTKAQLTLGIIAKKQGKFDESKKFFGSALASSDRQTKQRALLELALLQEGLGRKKEARQGFQEYLLKYPDGKTNEEVLLKLARLEIEEARYEQAGKWMIKLGQGYGLKKETLDELEGLLLTVKEKEPKQLVPLWQNLGKKFLDVKRENFLIVMAEALKGSGKPYLDLHQWLTVNGSEKVKIRSRLALSHYQVETGNLSSAWDGLKKLTDEKNLAAADDILRLKAKILFHQSDHQGAWDCLTSLKQVVLQDLPLMEETISAARDKNKALDFYHKVILRLGGNANSYIRLADLFYERRNTKEALRYYQKALEKDPMNEWGLFRAAGLISGEPARQMLERVKAGNSRLSKLAEIILKEKEVERKMGEIL
jgi:tetratricopeptide (TPR) repeat protein